ncbi:protein-L-isoaspartate(D-aspartate) O-methyltransferase [Sporocytophaga myxococcoides]|uniref:protein-L-isoaspartate(D-aspartate) O-methyltransferase n=1 Tax=Sporocytophaga myxococcoides TaxID=153721 RepID=UPI00040B6B25|nr:protein-L-isoaspartate(D-aspartate) O-methyltransferase [Sporocytophaga myxococcoides]
MEDNYKTQGLRRQLIKKLKDKGINDEEVLKAVEKVPRHFFFEKAFLEHAYEDKAFPIGEGQTISQPYTVAFQTSLLEIKKGDKVLEIGTGSGYQSSILLEMGAKLYTIEYLKPLYEKAKAFLHSQKYKVNVFCGDGTLGLPQFAPYNKILVTAGAPHVPEKLVEQLAPGGILVIPVGDEETQHMIKIIKTSDNQIKQERHGIFRFVPLTGKDGW